jgi:hypothetical protein
MRLFHAIINWFHHLFNPHCQQCRIDEEMRLVESKHCETCDALRFQLNQVNQQNRDLLNAIIAKNLNPVMVGDEPEDESENLPDALPLQPGRQLLSHKAWRIRQQTLEAEDRARAKTIAEQKKMESEARKVTSVPSVEQSDIAELENELGIIPEDAGETVDA